MTDIFYKNIMNQAKGRVPMFLLLANFFKFRPEKYNIDLYGIFDGKRMTQFRQILKNVCFKSPDF
jgi:hypothetical protein